MHPEHADETTPAAAIADCMQLHSALPDDGNLIVGPTPGSMARGLQQPTVMTFGRDGGCDVSATHILCEGGELVFAVDGQLVRLETFGRHFLDNALSAWAVGRAAGLDERTIAARLSRACLPARRCQVVQARDVTLIDDTACHSTRARRASLALLSTLAGRRRVVVCGDIDPPDRACGRELVEFGGADVVVAVGDPSQAILDSAVDAGMPRGHCHRCATGAGMEQEILKILAPGDNVLLTGVDAQLADRVLALFQNTVPAATATAAAA